LTACGSTSRIAFGWWGRPFLPGTESHRSG
jgi:hypothetical protein